MLGFVHKELLLILFIKFLFPFFSNEFFNPLPWSSHQTRFSTLFTLSTSPLIPGLARVESRFLHPSPLPFDRLRGCGLFSGSFPIRNTDSLST